MSKSPRNKGKSMEPPKLNVRYANGEAVPYILNAGGGYHVLIAGMERISVNIGQFVLTGEPVATMGASSQVASILATAPSQPVLYIEFRKDGTPIDPGLWWAASEGEKVRG